MVTEGFQGGTSTEEMRYLEERVYRDGQDRVDIQYSGAGEMYTWGGGTSRESLQAVGMRTNIVFQGEGIQILEE